MEGWKGKKEGEGRSGGGVVPTRWLPNDDSVVLSSQVKGEKETGPEVADDECLAGEADCPRVADLDLSHQML